MGGATSVRGYPEGDYFADEGILARLDYLVPVFLLPKGRLQDASKFVLFLDKGYGPLRAVTGEERTTRNLLGVGFGLLFQPGKGFSARLEWGFSLGDRPLTDDSRRVIHFRLQKSF